MSGSYLVVFNLPLLSNPIYTDTRDPTDLLGETSHVVGDRGRGGAGRGDRSETNGLGLETVTVNVGRVGGRKCCCVPPSPGSFDFGRRFSKRVEFFFFF